ncbi:MAG: bifunctional DNA-formamidopyrimidine glycosylase/DNA-(apurinic or apyrimidinic site) lyase [Planctomycetota bacterium]|nr:bifunctional DNA-formamidopyrimidine glycosylase/DNA-(apurinic or apyrimidinic site) lyase [Planctomycetota bacterium]
MPELPEVETVARLLRPDLVGAEIRGTRVTWERSLGGVSKRSFARRVVGTRIARIRRRAKYLLFDLERQGAPAGVIVGHLRMSGRMYVGPIEATDAPYVRVHLDLDGERGFQFVDVRKFGRFVYAEDEAAVLPPLGPEPLGDAFTAAWFRRALAGRKRMLKPLLLDQSFVAGLGNIYVDEALFTTGLHPLRRSDRVPAKKADALHAAIRDTLAEAIEREGSSFDTFYRTPEGQPGQYQHQFQVYGRTGKPCRRCERPIRRLVVGQRGTHVCTRCQPAPRPRRR